ncbi:MAG: DUF1080 domain-containing protein [Planctomycetaceae bacterium]|nr:DUF1080 domain-containing protein [Planctomycetaceae bacterium]
MPCSISRRVVLSAALLAIACGCPQAHSPPQQAAPTGETTQSAPEQSSEPQAADPAAAQTAAPAASPAAEPPPPYFNPLNPEQAAEGWISLFDGHTLYGWESNNAEVNWSVQDGAITADAGPIGLLNTRVPFANYEFACEFRMAAGGNSGVFLRTIPDPKDVKTDCYELNIADAHPDGFTTGAIVGHAKTAEPIVGSGDWKRLRVMAEGNHFVVTLDGAQVLDYTDATNARSSGLIGLQKNAGKVEFRGIILRPLGLSDLFNGTDTAGWRVVPGSKSEFTVEDGTIHLRNGPGFLETEQTFGNFIFQCDAQTHGDNLNSGFFFRAMPGTEEAPSNGYEVQIDNSLKEGDRASPANSGTGAIFRRTTARRVVSSDHQWCTITLVASANRFETWVNGYCVTDWTDERPSDENPRRGRRDEAGHVSLQGHDETTDISFRNLRAAEVVDGQ